MCMRESKLRGTREDEARVQTETRMREDTKGGEWLRGRLAF